MSTTPNIGLTLLDPGQNQKEVTINGGLTILDTLLQAFVTANNNKLLYMASGNSAALGLGAPLTISGGNLTLNLPNDAAKFLNGTGSWTVPSGGGGGGGTVTSVGVTMPSIFSVSGSPVTTTGTIAVTLASQAANLVLAGPTNGAAATPAFRALVAADLPNATTSAKGALPQLTGNTAQYLNGNGAWTTPPGTGVTSVAMTVPSIFTLSGSPITTSGTLAVGLATQSANLFLAGPGSGAAATPTFRGIQAADLPGVSIFDQGACPALPSNNTVWLDGVGEWTYPPGNITSVGLTMPSIFSVSGSPLTGPGTIGVTLATQAANLVLVGPTTGVAATPTFRALVGADIPLATTGARGAIPALSNSGTQYLDGTGNWSTPSGGGGGSPGGSNTQVQFNNAGAFGGSSNFTWNNTNQQLVVTGTGFFGIGASTLYGLAVSKTESTNINTNQLAFYAQQVLSGGVQASTFPAACRMRLDVSAGANSINYAAAHQGLAQVTNAQTTGAVNNLYGADFSARWNTNQAGANANIFVGGSFGVTADSSSNQGTITIIYGGQFNAGLPHGSSTNVTGRLVGGFFRVTVPAGMLTGTAFAAALQLENPSVPAGGAAFPGHVSHIRLEDFNFTATSGSKFPVLFNTTAADASRAGIFFGADGNNVALFRSANNTLGSTKSLSAANRITAGVAALTDGATISTDASLANHFRVTLGGNRTLANPTNPVDGQRVLWELIQDGTGSRTITLGSKFALGSDISSVTLTTTANKRDFLGAVYNAAADLWFVVAFVKGY